MVLRFLSASARVLTDCSLPVIKNFLIRLFVFLYKPNLREALHEQPSAYTTFNEFFARPLKKGARPLAKTTLVSPVDGKFIAAGKMQDGRIPTIKGQHYTLRELLGTTGKESAHISEKYKSGFWGLFYLSPKDYHRVHCPCAGKLTHIRFIPGKLLPVNDFVAKRAPHLYAQNQRAVFTLDTDQGGVLLVMVAALFVSTIETSWSGRQHALAPAKTWMPNASLTKGVELGKFLMGSSVILITEKSVRPPATAGRGEQIRVGHSLLNL